MSYLKSCTFDFGVEKAELIQYVVDFAMGNTSSTDMIIKDWDMDRIDIMDVNSNELYCVRMWDIKTSGKKRITVLVYWTLYGFDDSNNAFEVDCGLVEIRNGKVHGGSHKSSK